MALASSMRSSSTATTANCAMAKGSSATVVLPDPRIAVAARMRRLRTARRPDDVVDEGGIVVTAGRRLCRGRHGAHRVVIVAAALLCERAEEDAALTALRLA